MNLSSLIREQLAQSNLSMERFKELIHRLMAYGVVVRDEDRTEQLIYDDLRRCESVVFEYFEVAGMHLHHDVDSQFFRLYAPGAVVDNLGEDTNEPVPALKARLSVNFVAMALALRFLYQEKLNQGYIDSNAEALVTFEDVAVTMLSQFKRAVPESATERASVLAELKRHRLLRYTENFNPSNPDTYLAIRPTILGVISNEALAAALDADGELAPVEQTEEASNET